MIIGTERPISPIEKTLNAFISYHLESIWELASIIPNSWFQFRHKSCAIPEKEEKNNSLSSKKRKRGKAKVVPKSVGNEASGSAPQNSQNPHFLTIE